jgi:putative autotransporter adhesin-like protein
MRAARLFVFVALVLTGAAIVFISARTIASASSYRLAWDQVMGSGDVVAQTRSVAPFHAIASFGSAEVHVRVGGAQSVVVHAQGNIQPLIDTDVEDGTLHVGSHGSYSTDRKTMVDVTVPSLDAVSLMGSGDLTADGVHAGSLNVVIHGSGEVEVAGSADKLQFTSTGSGEGKFERLAVHDAVIRMRGSGDAHVQVAGTLDVELSGSGDVHYSGSPRITHQEVRGSGSISQN